MEFLKNPSQYRKKTLKPLKLISSVFIPNPQSPNKGLPVFQSELASWTMEKYQCPLPRTVMPAIASLDFLLHWMDTAASVGQTNTKLDKDSGFCLADKYSERTIKPIIGAV